MFCYVIEISSKDDLKVLEYFVGSLQCAKGLSEPINKLCLLFKVIFDIAELYMEAKSQQQQEEKFKAYVDKVNKYLSQLGLFPHEDLGIANTSSNDPDQVLQHADWLAGCCNIMGLMEEDLSQIHTYDKLL